MLRPLRRLVAEDERHGVHAMRERRQVAWAVQRVVGLTQKHLRGGVVAARRGLGALSRPGTSLLRRWRRCHTSASAGARGSTAAGAASTASAGARGSTAGAAHRYCCAGGLGCEQEQLRRARARASEDRELAEAALSQSAERMGLRGARHSSCASA